MAGPRMYDLFIDDEQTMVNPDLEQLARDEVRNERMGEGDSAAVVAREVHTLRGAAMLLTAWPAMGYSRRSTFFSRAGCDDAVKQCLHAGLKLTSPRSERSLGLPHLRPRTACHRVTSPLLDTRIGWRA